MSGSPQRPLRIAVITDGAMGMCLAESLLTTPNEAAVFVDLLTESPAPAGLLHGSPTGEGTPRLRLIGNVRVGADVTFGELHELYDAVVDTRDSGAVAPTAVLASAEITAAVFPDRPQDTPPRLLELLDARGVPHTSWQGWPTGHHLSTDWAALELASRGVPVCM